MLNVTIAGLVCISMLLVASSCKICLLIVNLIWKKEEKKNIFPHRQKQWHNTYRLQTSAIVLSTSAIADNHSSLAEPHTSMGLAQSSNVLVYLHCVYSCDVFMGIRVGEQRGKRQQEEGGNEGHFFLSFLIGYSINQ